MKQHTLQLAAVEDTLELGAALAKALQPPLTIYLSGELGSGKTTLVRGLAHALGYAGPVRSPTYTLLERYALGACTLLHLDLYRLADAEELELLGLRDELEPDAVCLVEWPERGVGHLPPADLVIVMQHRDGGRNATLSASSAAGRGCLQVIGPSHAHEPTRQ